MWHCYIIFPLFFSRKNKGKQPYKELFGCFFHSVCHCIWKKQHSASQLEQLSASHQLSSSRKHFHMVKVVYFS